MLIVGIAVSTMIAVAAVVFAVEMHMYKKHHGPREKERSRQAAPAASGAALPS